MSFPQCCAGCMLVGKISLPLDAARGGRECHYSAMPAMLQDRGALPGEGVVSVSVWRTLPNGVLEPWAEVKLSVDTSKPAEMVTVRGSDGSGKDSVTGRRSRLKVSAPCR